MNVWIAQLKCPNNHCVIGAVSELQDDNTASLEMSLLSGWYEMVEQGVANRWCGICKSTKLHVELARTKYNSLDEAKADLAASQIRQAATAHYLRAARN